MKSIQQSYRLVLAATIAFGFYYFFQWQEAYWIVISALLGVQFCPKLLWRGRLVVVLVAGLAAASLALLSQLISGYVFCLAVFLMLTTYVSVSLGVIYSAIWGVTFLTNFIATLSAGAGASSPFWAERFLCVLLGFVIAAFLQMIFFPSRSVASANIRLIQCFQRLSQLSRAIFSCFISRDYPEKHYIYDKGLHERRADCLYAITQLRNIWPKIENIQFVSIVNQVEHLYEILLSLGILLQRVGDHTTFEVASVEFTALAVSITDCFQMLIDKIKHPQFPTRMDEAFTEAIFQLEEINRSALQVVAREPIVFMFFINDLNELKEALLKLAEDIQKLVEGTKE
ncbi:MAG: hypothetical protein P4M14_13310 [Gammaproteobacteria bacterium]|nr:hypothetical protein [Gammaproteobacteria bacterium]